VTYFNLRKHAEPEPEEETEEEQPEEAEAEPEKKKPAKEYGPIITGLLGPGRWITARFGSTTTAIVHVLAVFSIYYYDALTAAGIILVWLAAALLFVPKEDLDRFSSRLERRSSDVTAEAPEAVEEGVLDPVVPLLWRLIADAPGTHLKTLTADLKKATPDQPLDKAAVRGHLAALNIPLRGSVRDTAGKVNEGVHRDDLKAWQEALPPTAPGTPPGPRSDPVATPVTCGVEKRRAPVATPLPRLRRLLSRGAG
jgi:hypothetical protein